MADKQMTEGLQIALENGALNVETVHPKAGEVFKSNQLAEINWFFTMLANKMGLKGKSSVTRLEESPPELLVDGEMVEMPNSIVLPPQQLFVYRGKSRNGEETEFSHNKFLPGMPFELTVVTTKTVTAKAKGGRELTLETLSKPFGEDVRAAMDTAGIDNLNGVTAVSETVRVLTLARVEWFPGIFEGSGTTYQITRIIRSETTRVITFAGLTGQITEKKEISIADSMTKPNKVLSDFDRMFADMPELNPILASQTVLIPVDELELSDHRPQLVTGRQGVSKFELVEKTEVIQPESEEDPGPEQVEAPEVTQPGPEEEPQLEPAEESEVIQSEPEEEPQPESDGELEVKLEPEMEPQPGPVEKTEVIQSEPEEDPRPEQVEAPEVTQPGPEEEPQPETIEEPEMVQTESEEESKSEPIEESEVQPESEEEPKSEPVEELEVQWEPEEEPQPEPDEEPEVIQPDPEEESKPEPVEEIDFSVQDLQRMFDLLVSQVSEPVQEKIPETVWPFEPVIVHSEPEQMIPQPEICQAVVVSQPVLEAAEVPTPADQQQTELQCTSPSRVSDRMVDDILGDLDMLITESSSQSYGRYMLPEAVQTKAVHNFFRLEKKHKK